MGTKPFGKQEMTGKKLSRHASTVKIFCPKKTVRTFFFTKNNKERNLPFKGRLFLKI